MSYFNSQPQNQFQSNTNHPNPNYPNHPSQAPPQAAQTRRPPKCFRCRKIKQKCEFSHPDEPCTLCAAVGEHCGPKQYAIDDRSERDQLDLTKRNFEKLRKIVETRLEKGQTWDHVFALFNQDQEQTHGPPSNQLNPFSTQTTSDYNPAPQSPWLDMSSGSTPFTSDPFQGGSTSYNDVNVFDPPYNPNFQSTFLPPEYTSIQYFDSNNPVQHATNTPGTMVQYPCSLFQNLAAPSLVYPPTLPAGSFVPYDPSNDSTGNGLTGNHAPYTS